MNEFEIYYTTRSRLETMWREAERRARLFAAEGELTADAESTLSRGAGGRV